MARIRHIGTVGDKEKDFLKLFDQLTYSRSAWQVWEDLMTVMACSISNAVDRTPDKFQRREEQYERSIKNLGGVEIPAQMLGIITMALEQNPDQDFLGKLYMSLNSGNHWKGQFFTPYNVCRMMAEMNFGDGVQAEVERKGYISVCDPCVGAGAMLIAAANTMRRAKLNYQTNAVFVGQDIDRIVAKMAYIQLSLLGCPGYITVGSSLTNPQTGHVLFPEENEGQELWIMPFFIHDIWEMRRTKESLLGLFGGTATTVKTVEKERFCMFFYFGEKEEPMETKGFNGDEISEKNKEALQSETWQEAGKAIKAEVRHFYYELLKDDPYGYPWEQVVDEYLKSGYKEEDARYELTVFGSTYKVLKREEVTVFYDADGNTLFDVVNERLEREYKWLMKWLMDNNAEADTGAANMGEGEKEDSLNNGTDIEVISPDDKELLPSTAADSQKENGRPAKLAAKEKLEKELKSAKDKNFAEPIIGYLLKRCGEDEGVAEDVAQEHKTWDKCLDYIYEQARKQATGNRAAVRDDVVYEWAEDYYHKDDKAEEAEKAKKEAEAKRKKAAAKNKPAKTDAKSSADRNKAEIPVKREKPKEQPRKRGREMEGQLDMFSMMGM